MDSKTIAAALDQPDEKARIRALKEGLDRKVDGLVEAVLDRLTLESSPRVRIAMIHIVGQLGGSEGARALVPLATDPEPTVRMKLLATLAQLEEPTLHPLIVRLLVFDGSPQVRGYAAKMLVSLGRDGLIGVFTRLMASRDPNNRESAIIALGLFSNPLVVPMLKLAYLQETGALKKSARTSLEKLADNGLAQAQYALEDLGPATEEALPEPVEEVSTEELRAQRVQSRMKKDLAVLEESGYSFSTLADSYVGSLSDLDSSLAPAAAAPPEHHPAEALASPTPPQSWRDPAATAPPSDDIDGFRISLDAVGVPPTWGSPSTGDGSSPGRGFTAEPGPTSGAGPRLSGSGDAVRFSGDGLQLSGDGLRLSGSALPVSGSASRVSGSAQRLSGSALPISRPSGGYSSSSGVTPNPFGLAVPPDPLAEARSQASPENTRICAVCEGVSPRHAAECTVCGEEFGASSTRIGASSTRIHAPAPSFPGTTVYRPAPVTLAIAINFLMAFLFATMGQKPGGVSIVFLVVAALWAFVNGIALYYGSMLAFASQVAMVILVPLVTRSPLDGMLGLMTVGLLTIFSRSREHMFGE